MISVEWRFDSVDPVIRDHFVLGSPVLPFAMWLVKCREAVTQLLGRSPREFRHVVVRDLTRFEPRVSIPVRFTGTPEGVGIGEGRFEVTRLDADRPAGNGKSPVLEGFWGADAFGANGSGSQPIDSVGARSRFDRAQFYRAAESSGLAYGPLLQRVANLDVCGDSWSAELAPPERQSDAPLDVAATWDAILQCGSVLAGDGSGCWIPYLIERVRLLHDQAGPERLPQRLAGRWVTFRPDEAGRRIADVRGFPAGSEKPSVEFLGVHYGLLKPSADGTAALVAGPRSAADPGTAPAATTNGAPSLETGGPKQVLERLLAATPDQRQALLVRFIEDELLTVLQWDGRRRGDLSRGLVEIGLDSLMSVDLQFRLQTSLKFALKPGQALNLQSITSLAGFLLDKHLHFR